MKWVIVRARAAARNIPCVLEGLLPAQRYGVVGFRLLATWAGLPTASDWKELSFPLQGGARRYASTGVTTVVDPGARANYVKKSKQGSLVERTRVLMAKEEHAQLERNANRLAAPCVLATAAAKEPIAAAAIFEQHGLLRVNGVLLPEECAALREHVNALLLSSIKTVASTETEFLHLFGPVMCRKARYDVLLPMDATVRSAVQQVLTWAAPVIMELAGAKASVCELSALVSDAGSDPQPIHHDTALFEEYSCKRVSMLVALQDVDEDMGPTVLFPWTNTPDWHRVLKMRGEKFAELLQGSTQPHVLGTMRAGDAILYDTNVLHCAGANTSNSHICVGVRRTLLVVSCQVEDHTNASQHTNIRQGYRGKFALKQHADWQVATPL